MRHMKALSLLVQKLMPRSSIFKFKEGEVGGQGDGIKNFGTDKKIFPQGMSMCNTKALIIFRFKS